MEQKAAHKGSSPVDLPAASPNKDKDQPAATPDKAAAKEKAPKRPKKNLLRDPFWFQLASATEMVGHTNGQDKIFKMTQYALKLVQSVLEHKALAGIPAVLVLANLYQRSKLKLVAKQISLGRKLFRFARSLHCILQIRQAMDQPHTFSRIIGLQSWFWNALWFVCDHCLWAKEIGMLEETPLLGLNKVCSVLMQVMQLCFNLDKLGILNDELQETRAKHQAELRASLEASRSYSTVTNSTVSKAEGAGGASKSVQGSMPQLTQALKAVSAPLHMPKLTRQRLGEMTETEKELLRVQTKLRGMFPVFVKNLGDAVVCFDFGFGWDMNPVWVNLAGFLAGIAGVYIEAWRANEVTCRNRDKQDDGRDKTEGLPLPARR
eukprot:g31866.t1